MASGPASRVSWPDPILVTGGAGFIGSHLCEALLQKGSRVICLDNFCSFYAPLIKRANISACLENPSFTLVEADITDPQALESVFATHKPALVAHLAAMAGVRPSIADPELYARVNVLGTLNLLQLCARHGVDKFIFASSSSVYGNNPQIPFSESDRVDDPISPYAATKKAGELLCHTWHHLYGISMLCLRFFTVYGPRQRPDLAIHKFLGLMARGEMIPVFGDGSSSRDYTYVADTVNGILGALDYVQNHPCYEIINLGNDRGVRLDGMIAVLEEVTGMKARQEHLPPQEGDVLRTRADISKARRLLGYDPSTSFEQGIARFWEWWRTQG
ncbi:MAG: SDR family NAD(P)-dependent oxidoreductase [Candidatus Syntrophosphaera sp.]|nr:SDR family NAD(P)-dependent oxidoreductase [Candidatus Syntrophosphaera sp.]